MLRRATTLLTRSAIPSGPVLLQRRRCDCPSRFYLWKKVVTHIETPKTPLTFMKVSACNPVVDPHQAHCQLCDPLCVRTFGQRGQISMDMVIIPAGTGHMSVLPVNVATIAELKPGVMSVHEGKTDVTKYFISSGFAFIHANSIADIIAVKAVPLDYVDASLVQKQLADFTQKLNSASTDLEKAEAQIGVDVHSALNSALTG